MPNTNNILVCGFRGLSSPTPGLARTPAISRTLSLPGPVLEQAQIKSRFAARDEIGQHFADGAREFKPVTGTGTGDPDVRGVGVPVDEEMVVGRIGVHANDRRTQRPIG